MRSPRYNARAFSSRHVAVSGTFAMADTVDTGTLREFLHSVREKFGASMAFITRVDGEQVKVLVRSTAQETCRCDEDLLRAASLCQHTVGMDFPLVIDDTYIHPLSRRNDVLAKMNVAAYLGVPLHDAAGVAIGTLCLMDKHNRRWSEAEIQSLLEAARQADTLLLAEA
jgi:GAF domain-containing protein